MFSRSLLCAAVLVLSAGAAPTSFAQVPRPELDPIRLDYEIRLNENSEVIGSAWFEFETIETDNGARLRLKHELEYTVSMGSPLSYREGGTLWCDEEGVRKFEAHSTLQDKTWNRKGVRAGENYMITVEHGDETKQDLVLVESTRSNLGLFCGGFLKEKISEGEMMREYPLFFPVGGETQPRQKFRESRVVFEIAPGKRTSLIQSSFKRRDKEQDLYLHLGIPHEPLFRMERPTRYGRLIFQLITIDGIVVPQSPLIQ